MPADRALASAAALLLAEGKRMDALSRPLTVVAAAGLLLAPLLAGPPAWGMMALLVLVVVLGIGQAFYAFRAGFDAGLFAALGEGRLPETLDDLDYALTSLGVMPVGKAGRPLSARIGGAMGLLRRQAALLLGQLLACVAAAVF